MPRAERPTIVRRLQAARDAHDEITQAMADGDPQAAIAASLVAIERLVDLIDGLLVSSVRVTRRRS